MQVLLSADPSVTKLELTDLFSASAKNTDLFNRDGMRRSSRVLNSRYLLRETFVKLLKTPGVLLEIPVNYCPLTLVAG